MIVVSRPCRRNLKWCLSNNNRKIPLISRGFYSIHNTPSTVTVQPEHGASSSSRSLYFDTIAPNQDQSQAASHFFLVNRPRISWVANGWRKQAYSNVASPSSNGAGEASVTSTLLTPEIAFLGRSNTGKSSLLNALLHSPDLCRVGTKPGKTTTMHAWTLSASASASTVATGTKGAQKDRIKSKIKIETNINDRLTVLDMPGYGHGSRDEWGADIVKYLTRRRQLRRAMVLLNPKHGLKEGDEQILGLLRTHGIPHQIVACKCDMLPVGELEGRLLDIRTAIQRIKGRRESSTTENSSMCIDDILVVGRLDTELNKMASIGKRAFGIDDVRWTILKAIGLDTFAVENWTKIRDKKKKRSVLVGNDSDL